jgi:hypothetical protein
MFRPGMFYYYCLSFAPPTTPTRGSESAESGGDETGCPALMPLSFCRDKTIFLIFIDELLLVFVCEIANQQRSCGCGYVDRGYLSVGWLLLVPRSYGLRRPLAAGEASTSGRGCLFVGWFRRYLRERTRLR